MATELDENLAAAQVYATSLHDLAQKAGQADEIGRELADLKSLWEREPSFAAMMRSAAIDDDARAALLHKAFDGRAHQLVVNLMLVLNDKRRAGILPMVYEAYRRIHDRHHGREDVFITSATTLSDAQRDVVRSQVKRLTGRDAMLVERIDPGLLGGLKVQIGDRLFDLTVRRRLRDMASRLLESTDTYLRGGTGRFVTEGSMG